MAKKSEKQSELCVDDSDLDSDSDLDVSQPALTHPRRSEHVFCSNMMKKYAVVEEKGPKEVEKPKKRTKRGAKTLKSKAKSAKKTANNNNMNPTDSKSGINNNREVSAIKKAVERIVDETKSKNNAAVEVEALRNKIERCQREKLQVEEDFKLQLSKVNEDFKLQLSKVNEDFKFQLAEITKENDECVVVYKRQIFKSKATCDKLRDDIITKTAAVERSKEFLKRTQLKNNGQPSSSTGRPSSSMGRPTSSSTGQPASSLTRRPTPSIELPSSVAVSVGLATSFPFKGPPGW